MGSTYVIGDKKYYVAGNYVLVAKVGEPFSKTSKISYRSSDLRRQGYSSVGQLFLHRHLKYQAQRGDKDAQEKLRILEAQIYRQPERTDLTPQPASSPVQRVREARGETGPPPTYTMRGEERGGTPVTVFEEPKYPYEKKETPLPGSAAERLGWYRKLFGIESQESFAAGETADYDVGYRPTSIQVFEPERSPGAVIQRKREAEDKLKDMFFVFPEGRDIEEELNPVEQKTEKLRTGSALKELEAQYGYGVSDLGFLAPASVVKGFEQSLAGLSASFISSGMAIIHPVETVKTTVLFGKELVMHPVKTTKEVVSNLYSHVQEKGLIYTTGEFAGYYAQGRILGFVGSKAYAKSPIKIKYEKFGLPTAEGQKVLYRGLGVEIRKKGYGVLGVSDEFKIKLGTPEIDFRAKPSITGKPIKIAIKKGDVGHISLKPKWATGDYIELYHGTTKESYSKIIKEGFKKPPSRYKKGFTEPYISTTTDLDVAKAYAGEKGKIVKLRIPKKEFKKGWQKDIFEDPYSTGTGEPNIAFDRPIKQEWIIGEKTTRPKIDLSKGFISETSIGRSIVEKGIKKIYPTEEIVKFQKYFKVQRATEKVSSAFIEKKFITETKTLSPKGVKKVLAFAKKEEAELYGSFPARQQLPKDLRTRVPADIDIQLGVGEAAAIKKADKLVKELRLAGEDVRRVPGKALIEARGVDKTWHHAVDIHSTDIPMTELTSPALAQEGVYGFKFGQKPVKIEGVKIMPLSEQGVRKGASIFTLREKGFAPELHRTKDILDFFTTQEALAQSIGGIKGKMVLKELEDLKSLYPEELFKTPGKQGKFKIYDPKDLKSGDFMPGRALPSPGLFGESFESKGLAKASSVSDFRSVSVWGAGSVSSPLVSSSVKSMLSPSPRTSPKISKYASPSPRKSLSPSASISPGKSVSPSPYFGKSPKVSPSPSPSPASSSISPSPSPASKKLISPSIYKLASPSPSPSPSPYRDFNEKYLFPPVKSRDFPPVSREFSLRPVRQPKMLTPTGRSSLFGLTGKTTRASVQTGLGERYISGSKKKRKVRDFGFF